MKSTIAKIIISIFALGVVFVFGQVAYYNKKIASTVNVPKANLSSRLTANLSSVIKQKLVLKSENWEVPVSSTELKKWIEAYKRDYTGKEELRVSVGGIEAYLQKIAAKVSIAPINARLIINEGRASEFEPSQDGQKLNIPSTITNIITSLAHARSAQAENITINLAIDKIESEVTLNKINRLGLNELLARGESDFGGSPKSRTHNINVGSQKFNGIIVAPGENFSFNQWLGEVAALTGYLPELVIKSGKLIPEYGGGLCQVSTTLFRAAAAAGLPILERKPHSLPVRYYNPQGYDATVYPGITDLRFKNDTPAHILIQSKIVGSKLYFEIYGTKDGRKIVVDGPRQYDIKPDGSLKAELIRTIAYPDGQEKKDIFKSSYKSPALFPTVRNPLE